MPKMNFRKLQRIMTAHGWRDADVCRGMGVSHSHWCDLKSGRRQPSAAVIDLVAEFFRLRYDDFLSHPCWGRPLTSKELVALASNEPEPDWEAMAKSAGVYPPQSEERRIQAVAATMRANGRLPKYPFARRYGRGQG